MNIIDDALDSLAAELATVLPGRTTADPRRTDVGPSIWIDVPTITPDRPISAKHVTADFPVHITADGADQSQVAFLNDAVAKVWDACDRLPLCYPVISRPDPASADVNRAVTVTVRMVLRASGFCLPAAPTAAPIPPDPIDPVSEED